jgi:cation:H+ antiporter
VFDAISSVPPLVLLGVGVALLVGGANWLVDGAVALARGLGISALVVGLTAVAFGTSAPELVVNIIAALDDNADLSFGNVVGSNIANIGLVIGIAALMAPVDVHSRIIRRELPWMILASVVTLVLALLPATGRLAELEPGRWLTRTDGLVLIIGFIGFVAMWFAAARSDARDPLTTEAVMTATARSERSPLVASGLFLIGLILLLVGGKLTELGAVEQATRWGWSNTLIGLTVVAVATSLPELFAAIIAAMKGHADLAIGNVVGSNIFNLLLVLATTATISNVPIAETTGIYDLVAMIIMSMLLLVVAFTHRRRVNRIEGAVLLLLYLGYMTWCVVR